MILIRTGTWSELRADGSPASLANVGRAHTLLDKPFSYFVAGAVFSPAYQEKRWDGRIRLVKRGKSGLRFPSGLFREIVKKLEKEGIPFTVEDRRPETPKLRALETWTPQALGIESLRPYQDDAVEAALAAEGGILKIAIRGGKTLIASKIIHRLGLRALFVVPSQLLLDQTIAVMRSVFPRAHVTECGDGTIDLDGDIVVGTVQSLMTRVEQINAEPFGTVFLDECHHSSSKSGGSTWKDALLDIDARYKYGLTATLDFQPSNMEAETIWVRGICGPIVYEISMSQLIDLGFLTRPRVKFVRFEAKRSTAQWHPKLYQELIVDCEARNERFIDEILPLVEQGHRVLFDVGRVRHARLLFKMLQHALPPGRVAVLTGKSDADERRRVLRAFRSGEIPVVVGTLLGEGIDIPELSVVVNAEAGKGDVGTVQRMRNMTFRVGKDEALVIEAADLHHPRLAEWTEKRLRTYMMNSAFHVEVEGG